MIDGVEVIKGYMELCNLTCAELRSFIKKEDQKDILHAFLETDTELMAYIHKNGEKLQTMEDHELLETLWIEWKEELFLIFDEMMEYKKNN
jgi:hypothetical protein